MTTIAEHNTAIRQHLDSGNHEAALAQFHAAEREHDIQGPNDRPEGTSDADWQEHRQLADRAHEAQQRDTDHHYEGRGF